MSITKRQGGESSRGRIVPDTNPSRCGRIDHGANRHWGDSSMGRKVQWAKRPVIETHRWLVAYMHLVAQQRYSTLNCTNHI